MPCTIYDNCRNIRLSVRLEKTRQTENSREKQHNRVWGRPASNPRRPLRRDRPPRCQPDLPEARLRVGLERGTSVGILRSVRFTGTRSPGPLLPSAPAWCCFRLASQGLRMQWLTNDMLRPLRRAFSLRPEEHGFEFALQGRGASTNRQDGSLLFAITISTIAVVFYLPP